MKILSLTELNPEQQLAVQALEILCKSEGNLQGNMHWDKSMNFFADMRHWFLLYNEGVLMAALSAFAPSVSQVEFSGYTLPKARRKGCFSLLLDVATEEARKFGYRHMLLITERASEAGQAFVRHLNAAYSNTEYQLVWRPWSESPATPTPALELTEAALADLEPLTRLSRSIFGGTTEEARQILETTIHTPHLTQYVATLDGRMVGMVAVNFEQTTAWIIGLGVGPDQQGKGLGKSLLHQTLHLLRHDNRAETIMIEVDSSNEVALNLYQNAGFVIQTGQDYFKLPL